MLGVNAWESVTNTEFAMLPHLPGAPHVGFTCGGFDFSFFYPDFLP